MISYPDSGINISQKLQTFRRDQRTFFLFTELYLIFTKPSKTHISSNNQCRVGSIPDLPLDIFTEFLCFSDEQVTLVSYWSTGFFVRFLIGPKEKLVNTERVTLLFSSIDQRHFGVFAKHLLSFARVTPKITGVYAWGCVEEN